MVKLLPASERVKVYVEARSGRILEAKAEQPIIEPPRRSEAAISGGPTSFESIPWCDRDCPLARSEAPFLSPGVVVTGHRSPS
jgi:hypothetical protein